MKCDKCQKEFKNGRALTMHQRYHCSVAGGAPVGKKEKHEHEFELLSPTTQARARAIQAGYKKICSCGEIE